MPEGVYELYDVWKVYGSGSSAVAALRGASSTLTAVVAIAAAGIGLVIGRLSARAPRGEG